MCRLKDVDNSDGKLVLAFEWMDKDLKKYMDSAPGGISMPLIKSYLYQLLRGMDYCHGRGVMHRDLKPQNLLVDRKGVLKIADFGLARAFMLPMRAYTHEVCAGSQSRASCPLLRAPPTPLQVVTLWYRAPEILLGQRAYAPAVDMWSIGAIFVEMVNRVALWPGDSEIDTIFKIFRWVGLRSTRLVSHRAHTLGLLQVSGVPG